MQQYIVQAKCLFSGYTDVASVQADSASDAVAKWSDQQFNIAGIQTDYRYGKVTACLVEHFKPGNVKADNIPVNLKHSTISDRDADIMPYSHASNADKKEAKEILEDMQSEAKFAKANNVTVNDIYWDDNDKLQIVDANNPPF
jgi:hypothetical protein